jgi:hypothetical protein
VRSHRRWEFGLGVTLSGDVGKHNISTQRVATDALFMLARGGWASM